MSIKVAKDRAVMRRFFDSIVDAMRADELVE